MKTTNKLVALLLAAVMVLGLMPSMTVHAHAHTHAAELNGIEEYPVITADTPATATIANGGDIVYFTFTPEKTDLYYVYSTADSDTVGYIYDADMNQINYNDDSYYGGTLGVYGPNFCMEQVMEAGTTYVIGAKYYSSYYTGDFTVTAMTGHSYTSEVTKEATCTEDGVLTHTCTYCGDSYEEVIPAAHSYDEKTGACIYCGEAYLITGVCGENLTWELDYFGNLTIKGTGDMYNYVVSYSENYPAPWYNDYANAITALVVEEGVTSIGSYAFYNCQQMASVSLPESLTALGANSFSSCYGMTEIALPDAITTIPDSCFKYCGSLESIIWPASLTAIESNAFYSCNLSNLIVPEGVTSIGQYAFSNNSSLSKLTLPSTLTTLSDYAFASMYNTKDFIFKGDAPTFGGSQVFQYITANAWYPLGNETWTEEIKQNYGGTITWSGLCSGSHAWGEVVNVPATCETGSYMTMTCTVCGYTEISPENDDALGHDYQIEHYAGSCGDYSYDITTCSRCDYYTTTNWVWTDHTYETTTVEATCEIGGYNVHTCSICGYYYESDYTAPLGHDVAEWSEPTEATCTDDGVKTGFCARCEQTVSEVVTPALGHEWDMENGTANADGSMTYPCIRCDATYTTEGSSLHLGDNQFTIAAGTASAAKTYTAEKSGKLTIKLNDLYYFNDWSGNWTTMAIDYFVATEGAINIYVNGVNTGYTVEGSELEANIVLNTIEVAKGDTVEVELAHTSASWLDSTDVRFNVNLALEAEEEPDVPEFLPLVLGDNEISMFANSGEGPVYGWTATEDGNLTVQFTKLSMYFYGFWSEEPVVPHLEDGDISFMVNGDRFTVDSTTVAVKAGDVVTVQLGCYTYLDTNAVITLSFGDEAPHEHSFGEWVVTTEPTCTEVGIETRTCECGETETREVAALGHTEEVIPGKDATCTEPGLTEGKKCSVCGEILVAQEEIPALGHTEEVIPGKDATCTEPGLTEGKKCSVCGEILVAQEEIPATGHVNTVIRGVSEPTCTDDGYTGDTWCLDCEQRIAKGEIIPALGHDWHGTGCSRCDEKRENPFTDVPEDSFYIDPVLWAVEKGITTGATETTFNPNGNCMRAHVVTFLWRAAGSPEPTSTNNPFVDVKETDFFYKAVLWAVENEITNGLTTTTFGPYAECNRAQVVTFLWRARSKPEPTATEHPFTDVAEDQFYYNAMLWAVENGITNGLTETTFGPNATCNRAQVVTFLYRTYVK